MPHLSRNRLQLPIPSPAIGQIGPLANGESELFRVDVNTYTTHAPADDTMARSFLVVACLFSAIVLASAARPNPHDGLALKLSRHNLGTKVASDLGHVLAATESLSTQECDAAYKILNNEKSSGGYIETVEKIFAIARAVGEGRRRVRRAPQGPLGLGARLLQAILSGFLDSREDGPGRPGRRRGREGSPRWARDRVAPRERYASLPAVPAGGHEGRF